MSFIQRFNRALVALVVITGLLAMTLAPAGAQEGGSGIQISPTRTEISVLSGEKKSFKLNIKNITPGVITAQASVNDFESDNESGTPLIIVDPNLKSDYSIRDFIKDIPDIDLQPNETREVTINIDVTPDTAPGAYFGAIRFAAVPKGRTISSDERRISLTASVASLVLLQIPGEINEGMKYESLQVLRNGKAGTFFTQPPNELLTRLTNTGNSFVQPFGRVVVNKGGKEVHSFEFNFNNRTRGTILPKSSRNFNDSLQNIKGFGKYEVVSNLSFRQGGEVLTQKKTFWVVPVWMLVLLGIVILGLLLGIAYITLRLRRH